MQTEPCRSRRWSEPRESFLELLVTASCSRCDEALDWLLSMPELAGRALVTREVMDDDLLLARYGERVPVLRVDGSELDWPFDAEALRRALPKQRS